MISLKSLTTAEIPLLKEYLSRFPRESCDYSICNLMTWGRLYNDQYTIWQGNLVVFNPKYQAICFPIGNSFKPRDLVELIQMFRIDYPQAELILIPHDYIENHPETILLLDISTSDGWSDYVYKTEKLVMLSGKKLAKKKNLISQFIRNYPDYKILPITAERRDVIVSFTEKWKRQRDAEGIYLQSEIKALTNAMDMWNDIPIDGILICLHNRIVAFSIFSEQTTNMATIHFEKFDPDKKGSAQMINFEAAKYLLPRYEWINREQDMALEGLRQAKRSYLPDRMIDFYTATLKK